MAKRSKNPYPLGFSSSLSTGAERFLSQAIVQAFEDGWRKPEDFLQHFKPQKLMEGFASAPDLRAQILVKAAGVHEKIARKKSTTSAAEDLRLALDEGICDAKAVVDLIPPDDRVRYLNQAQLWKFLVDDEFWGPLNAEANRERAVGRMVAMIEGAIGENLLSLRDLADGIGFDEIANRLPLKELQKVVKHALQTGRKDKALDEEQLLEVVPMDRLIGYLSLEQIWNEVIVAKVAAPAGFTDAAQAGKSASKAKPSSVDVKGEEATAAVEFGFGESTASEAAVAEAKPGDDVSVSIRETDDEIDPGALDVGGDRPAGEEDARRKVLDKLRSIERLPPNADALPTPILLSIESMYAELLSASNDEAREEIIRDSFPNAQHLTTAMLALIELLDPSIDINDPVIREADVDSLIKVVLFEERHRYEQLRPSMRPPPPANAPQRRSGVPPPLPRASSTPPPLPAEAKRAR